MTNLSAMIMKLSPRARRALEVLQNGGEFVRRLERDPYTNREQFQVRLMNASRNVIKGYGFKVFWELEPMLVVANGGTSISAYYKLPKPPVDMSS